MLNPLTLSLLTPAAIKLTKQSDSVQAPYSPALSQAPSSENQDLAIDKIFTLLLALLTYVAMYCWSPTANGQESVTKPPADLSEVKVVESVPELNSTNRVSSAEERRPTGAAVDANGSEGKQSRPSTQSTPASDTSISDNSPTNEATSDLDLPVAKEMMANEGSKNTDEQSKVMQIRHIEQAGATEEEDKDKTLCRYQQDTTNRWFDKTHRLISRSVCLQAVRFDRFFGDIRNTDDYRSSFMRVRNSFIAEQEEDIDYEFRPRLRARFYLPQLQEKFNLIVFDDSNSEETLSSAEETVPEETQQTNRYTAALRWVVNKGNDLQLDFDVGARFDSNIQTFVRWRYRKIIPINEVTQVRLSDAVRWRDPVGFGNNLRMDLERVLSPLYLFRWRNSFTFSEESDGIDWGERLTLYQRLSDKDAISYSIGMSGYTRPVPEVENYGISLRYRRNVLRSWLFLELEPEFNWPLERQRETTPKLTFRVEIQFG